MGKQTVNILVTGANGFIGKNLIQRLKSVEGMNIYPFDVDTDPGLLGEYAGKCDTVFHLAGVNRPKDESEYMEGNLGFTDTLLKTLSDCGNDKARIIMSSSI